MPIDKNDLARLRAEHKDIVHLTTKWGDDVVFRGATDKEYERFQVEYAEPGGRPFASRNLVMGCCVYPDRERLEAMLQEKPGILMKLAGEVTELSGAVEDAVRKK